MDDISHTLRSTCMSKHEFMNLLSMYSNIVLLRFIIADILGALGGLLNGAQSGDLGECSNSNSILPSVTHTVHQTGEITVCNLLFQVLW